MKIKNTKFRILIIVNLVTVLVMFVDICVPYNQKIYDRYSSTYSTTRQVPGFKSSGGNEVTTYLEGKSGETYKLGIDSQEIYSLVENQNIILNKTFIFQKVKSVEVVKDNQNIEIKVAFLYNNLIVIIILIAAIITLLNIFFSNGFLDFMLAFATAFIYFTTMIYLVYF